MKFFGLFFLLLLFFIVPLTICIFYFVAMGHLVGWSFVILFIISYIMLCLLLSFLFPWFILYVAGVKQVKKREIFSFGQEKFVLYLMRRRLPLPIAVKIPFRQEVGVVLTNELGTMFSAQEWYDIANELEKIFLDKNLLLYQICAVLLAPYLFPIWLLEKLLPAFLFMPLRLIFLAPVALFLQLLRSKFPLYDLSVLQDKETPLIEQLVVKNDNLPLGTSLDIYLHTSDYFFSIISLFHRYEVEKVRDYEMNALSVDNN